MIFDKWFINQHYQVKKKNQWNMVLRNEIFLKQKETPSRKKDPFVKMTGF